MIKRPWKRWPKKAICQAGQHSTSPDISCAAFANPSADEKIKHDFQEMGTIKEKVFLVFQSVREGCLLESYLIYN